MAIVLIVTIMLLMWFISFYGIRKPFINYLFASVIFHLLFFASINNEAIQRDAVYDTNAKLSDKSTLKKNDKDSSPKSHKNTQSFNKTQKQEPQQIVFIPSNSSYPSSRLKQNRQKNKAKEKYKGKDKSEKIAKSNEADKGAAENAKIAESNNNTKGKSKKTDSSKKELAFGSPKYWEAMPDTKGNSLTDAWLNNRDKLEKYIYKQPQDFYLIDPNKRVWQDFSLDLSMDDKDKEFSIKGFDNFTHKDYMRHILEEVGYTWFYKYTPIEQLARKYIRISTPITVGFNLENSGKIKDFRFLKKGSVAVQMESIRRTFAVVRLKKTPKRLSYRNIKMRFIIYPPILDKTDNSKIYLRGEIQIKGEVKIND